MYIYKYEKYNFPFIRYKKYKPYTIEKGFLFFFILKETKFLPTCRVVNVHKYLHGSSSGIAVGVGFL